MADSGDDERLLLLLLLFILYDKEDVCNGTKEGEGCSHYFCTQLMHSSMILTNENITQMKLYSLPLYIPV